MAIFIDKDGNVVTYENEPEQARAMFPNLEGSAIDEINALRERLDRIYPGTNAGFISNNGAIQNATADAEVYTDEFPVTPGNKITVTLKYSQDRSMWLAYCLYDASHTFISRTMLVNSVTQKYASVSFTVPDGAQYCRLTYRSFNDATIIIDTTGQRLFDVQVAGSSVVINGVADIPESGTNVYGAIRVASDYDLRNTTQNNAVVSKDQHKSMFYGMAKAAGDTTQAASDNVVGNYTDQAKIAIRQMLGIPSHFEAELINDITTEQALDTLSIITDIRNESFALRKARLVAFYPPSTISSNSYLSVHALDFDTNATFYYGNQQLNADTNAVIVYDYEGFGAYFDIGSFKVGALGATSGTNVKVAYNAPSKAIKGITITKNSASTTSIPEGTRFILYGIRA